MIICLENQFLVFFLSGRSRGFTVIIFKYARLSEVLHSSIHRKLLCPLNSKCSKILNTFLFLFSKKILVFRAVIHKKLVRIPTDKTLIRLRSSFIWVCILCLGLFGRQLVFEILESLPFTRIDLLKSANLFIFLSFMIFCIS